MPSPRRRASPRTAAAIAEDLAITRSAGGLARASSKELASTLDWLPDSDAEDDTVEARDLLTHYIRRVCEAHDESSDPAQQTVVAAARSLTSLLLRPASDDRLVAVIRRGTLEEMRLRVTTDAVRHREDYLLSVIAEQVANELAGRDNDGPPSVAAAAHRLAPLVIDLREQLHDGLCLLYPQAPPADPRERRVLDWFRNATIVELGDLLAAAIDLEEAGLRQPNLSRTEFALVNFGRHLSSRLFDELDDRARMVQFVQTHADGTPLERSEQLRADEGLRPVFERWTAWIGACYPTCAFERSPDVGYMCSPHAYLTLLYDFEVALRRAGYSEPDFEENNPLRHHALAVVDAYRL